MDKDLKHLEDQAFYLRGKIINHTIILERVIDEYLTNYFCGEDEEKRKVLMYSLFGTNRITLDSKRQLFEDIIKKDKPDFVKKHPYLKKDLIYIAEQRNILAHYMLNSSDDGINNHDSHIEFVNFKGERKIIRFEEKTQIDLISKIEKSIISINSLNVKD